LYIAYHYLTLSLCAQKLKMMKTRTQVVSVQHMIQIIVVTCQIASVSAAVTYANQDDTSSYARDLADTHDHDHDHDHDHGAEESKPWGSVIGFTLVVNLATLSGVIFLIPLISRNARKWVKSFFSDNRKSPDDAIEAPVSGAPKNKEEPEHIGGNFVDVSIPSFAGGALIATAFFLVIPEALYLIQKDLTSGDEDGHVHRFLQNVTAEEEEDIHEGEIIPAAVWRFGSSLLGGFMLPMLIDLLFPRDKKHREGDECVAQDHFEEDVEHPKTEEVMVPKKINYGLVTSIILGDAFHNFCDGIFVGVALMLCDSITAYTIVAITLYHEIAQELADYFLLTKHAGLTPLVALSLNFTAGLSVMIGGITVLATPVSDMLIGVVLSLASGTYLYISCVECLPRVADYVETRSQRVLSMVMFIIGVVPISLTLLNHQHCEAGHEEH
jgi:zinc transporter ZupT